MNFKLTLLLLALSLIIGLTYVAWLLKGKIDQQKLQVKQREKEAAHHANRRRQYINKSIQILAKGIVSKQIGLTEGAIRISVLLDNLDLNESQREEFSAIFQLAQRTAHIPILDGWRRLSKQDQFRYDQERLNIEKEYQEFIVDAAQRMIENNFTH